MKTNTRIYLDGRHYDRMFPREDDVAYNRAAFPFREMLTAIRCALAFTRTST